MVNGERGTEFDTSPHEYSAHFRKDPGNPIGGTATACTITAGRGINPPAHPLCPKLIVLMLFAEFAKDKKDKIQKSRGNPDTAEAYNGVAVGRIAVVPIGNGAVVGKVVPATTAPHTARPAAYAMRISLSAGGVCTIDIPTPFPDIAAHVKNAQFIGCFCTNIMSSFA